MLTIYCAALHGSDKRLSSNRQPEGKHKVHEEGIALKKKVSMMKEIMRDGLDCIRSYKICVYILYMQNRILA